MDDTRFADVTKRTTSRLHRRGLGLLALLGFGAGSEAGAADNKKSRRCKANQQKCGNRCIPKSKCCKTSDCPRNSGQVCQENRCRCPNGKRLCNGVCFPADGCCANADCKPTELCAEHRCVAGVGSCLADQDFCSNGVKVQCNNVNGTPCFCVADRSGQIRCGIDPPGPVACSSDASCASLGAGAFCRPDTGSCSPGECVLPCPLSP